MKCRLKKLQLGATEVDYSGYNVSRAHGIRPGAVKTEAMRKWSPPTTKKEIKQFLGLCSFFQRTIPDFATLSAPLSSLTRDSATWSGGLLPQTALTAFQQLQAKLGARPTLHSVNYNLPFTLAVSTSSTSIHASLLQGSPPHPSAYASCVLSPAETRWDPAHQVLLAKVWGCLTFRAHLLGRPFSLRAPQLPRPPQLTAARKLSFDKLEADLSTFRPFHDLAPRQQTLLTIDSPPLPACPVSFPEFRTAQKTDPFCKALFCAHAFKLWPSDPPLLALCRQWAPLLTTHDGPLEVCGYTAALFQ